ncbi:hypothetical protein D3C80_2145620 [compost metagenome]
MLRQPLLQVRNALRMLNKALDGHHLPTLPFFAKANGGYLLRRDVTQHKPGRRVAGENPFVTLP